MILQTLGGKELFAESFACVFIDSVSVFCPFQKAIVYDYFLCGGILRIIKILIQLRKKN